MKKLKWWILAIAILGAGIAILGAGIAFYAWQEFTRTHKSTENIQPEYKISAAEFMLEFETDEAAASKKYIDKVIEVEGVLTEHIQDDNSHSLVLEAGENGGSIFFEMDKETKLDIENLKPGQVYRIRGVCAGYNEDELLGSDIILVRAVIIASVQRI
jgi:hypothetical protein